ncbi:phage major capsid protein, partial [Lactococcus lactis]|uniref:phage major capsid protein n=1 Tax=Lactococcus lactis TaxID=1358 RepID=UPI0021A39264
MKTFIILQLSESIAVALEAALVNGDGNNKPVGLIKDATVVNGTTTYGDKTVSADLSPLAALENSQDVSRQAAKILAPIMKKMSVSEKGIPLNIAGQAKILVNPQDYYNFTAMF